MKGLQYALKNSVKEYRNEQMRVAEILRRKIDISPGYIKTEYPVTGLEWEGEKIGAILDIAIIPPQTSFQYKIAIRLMGEIHNRKRHAVKDDKQKLALEKDGWLVFDFIEDFMPNLWSKTQNDEIRLLAEKEVLKAIE